MNEVYIDIRTDDELQKIFTSDFVSVEQLRNKLVDYFNQINSEDDGYDTYKDQYLEEKLKNE